jgi:predicted phage tail protein
VRWADLPESSTLETFDMTQYCTSREHAFMVAKYFLSLRRRVTHTINFKTTPYGLSLAPGDYIRVITQANVYNAANNGVVSATGEITSVTPLADGRYRVFYWNANFDEPSTEEMTVASGKVVEPKFYSSVFTVEDANVSSNTYMIEQLTIGEDGLVDIAAAHFPTTNTFNSDLALDLLNDSLFETEG